MDRGKLKPVNPCWSRERAASQSFAIQVAAALGARVIATSSSDEKLVRVKALGATDVINYAKEPEWHTVAQKRTGGIGVDHVLEVVGGESLDRSIQAARVGGHVAVIGFLGGQSRASTFSRSSSARPGFKGLPSVIAGRLRR